jgi:hypothetical protein
MEHVIRWFREIASDPDAGSRRDSDVVDSGFGWMEPLRAQFGAEPTSLALLAMYSSRSGSTRPAKARLSAGRDINAARSFLVTVLAD